MSEKKVVNQFLRVDDFNPGVDFSDSIQEKWIHKQVVKVVGDSEDDFIIEEKPVLVDRIDLHKQIQEEAKTTDLKSLLKQLLAQGITNPTGDEPELNGRPGFYGDITGIQEAIATGAPLTTPEQVRATLPDELKGLTSAQIASMNDMEIIKYVNKVRAAIEDDNTSKSEEVVEKKEG